MPPKNGGKIAFAESYISPHYIPKRKAPSGVGPEGALENTKFYFTTNLTLSVLQEVVRI